MGHADQILPEGLPVFFIEKIFKLNSFFLKRDFLRENVFAKKVHSKIPAGAFILLLGSLKKMLSVMNKNFEF